MTRSTEVFTGPVADQTVLRMYLRSNVEKDQDTARARCAAYGIDYEQARKEVR